MKPTTLFLSILGAISTASISMLPSFAQTTPVPITGGSLGITNLSAGGGVVVVFNPGAIILTSFGPISVSSGTVGNANSQAGAVVQNGVLAVLPTRPDQVGDSFTASGIASGSLSGNTLNNFNYAVTGTISSITFNPPVSSQVNFALNGGNVSLPSSLVSSLSGTTGGTNNSPISSIIPLNDVDASNLFNSQPVLESGKNFLPPSSLAGSRIHPDLSSR